MTNLINQTLNNRYRLEALLGDGGMGTVYRAADLNLERQVAVKLMHSHFARQEEFRARLVQEARTSAQLDHPSIVRVYDFGDSELGLFIAMEYVDGGSLRDHLRRLQRLQKYLPLAQCLQIGIQIAEALDYAHRRKIIHRDVKPGNIILKRLSRPDEAGAQPFRALLTDFGLVKLQEGTSLTQSGATVGTPTYMSPEQCEGRELDGRSDLYSLGIVLYELVANKLPFTFQTLSEAIAAHQNNVQAAPASLLRPEVPPIIDSLLTRAMAKSPDQRFDTGAEMADALRSAFVALEGLPTRVMLHQELDILDQVAEPPVGFELQIQTPGHADSLVALTRAVIWTTTSSCRPTASRATTRGSRPRRWAGK
jgi:serine/threonine protein kinase